MRTPFALLLTIAGAQPAKAETQILDPLPASLIGAWEVEHVAADREDQPHWSYVPDDPYLMGREFVVEAADRVSGIGVHADCNPATWTRHSTSWGYLMDTGFPRAGNSTTTPADFGLKVSAKANVVAYSLCETSPSNYRPGVPPNWAMYDVWLVQPAADRLVMHLNSSVMLILARRPADARPRASFPCQKATTPVEKTICGSFRLASLDRSVALAWRRSTRNGVTADAIAEQKAWLRTRDACGSDVACLEQKMFGRITELK
jgi:hypothetical protein